MSKPVHSHIVLVRPRGKDLLPKIAYFEEYNRTGKISLEIPSFEAGMQSMLLRLPLMTNTVSELRPYANGIGLLAADVKKLLLRRKTVVPSTSINRVGVTAIMR